MMNLKSIQKNDFLLGALSASFFWMLGSFFWERRMTLVLRRTDEDEDVDRNSNRNFFGSVMIPDSQLEDFLSEDEDEVKPLEKKPTATTSRPSRRESTTRRGSVARRSSDIMRRSSDIIRRSSETMEAIRRSSSKVIRSSSQMIGSMITRERWPWESIRSADNDEDDDDDEYEKRFKELYEISAHDSLDNDESNHMYSDSQDLSEKTEMCIGSYIGLDVGGTLSKLLYFEEKPEQEKVITMKKKKAKSEFFRQSFFHPIQEDDALNGPKANEKKDSNDFDEEENEDELLNMIDNIFSDKPPEVESEQRFYNSFSGFDTAFQEQQMQQALDRFYTFVRQLGSYGPDMQDKSQSFYSRTLGGEFHFIQFETRHMIHAMQLMKSNNLHRNISEIGIAGGGAHKYADLWDQELGITIAKQGELDSLVAGMQFILADVVGECYTYQPCGSMSAGVLEDDEDEEDNDEVLEEKDGEKKSTKKAYAPKKVNGLDLYWYSRKVKRDLSQESDAYPYLLVMIGTGVSVLRVDGPRKHERVSGSTIGGGTYWGLCKLLTDAVDFKSALDLAEQGDPSKVDM